MNFKADWSFLEKISMGAVASQEVIRQLNSCGHQIIELERYSTSNKIWSTKIKRLRLPDLICLKCGRRIESRAKSNLDVRMSDNENNPDRRWDAGLSDKDLVAFIQCSKDENGWYPAKTVNYFDAKSMRDTVGKSKLGEPKSAGEGAERDRVWPTSIPSKDGEVIDIITLADKVQIKVKYDDGSRPYTYSIKNDKGYHVYVNVGDHFESNATMIAGVPTNKTNMDSCCATYDFLNDLRSPVKEIRYAGVKALGYLAKNSTNVNELKNLLLTEVDHRIKLEIYASLLRLGEDLWDEFKCYAMSISEEMYRFEYVLILGELSALSKATDELCRIALDSSYDSELRSAAAWGIPVNINTLDRLMSIASVVDDSVASHSIANIIENINDTLICKLFDTVTNEELGGIALKILTDSDNISKEAVERTYQAVSGDVIKMKWCAMAIGLMGTEGFDKDKIRLIAPDYFETIRNLWDYSKSTVSDYRTGEIEFLRKQSF